MSSAYKNTRLHTDLGDVNRSIVKNCKGDFTISLLTIKAISPKMYSFDSVISYNHFSEKAKDIKYTKSFYKEAHPIDDIAFKWLKRVDSGTLISKSVEEWGLSKSFMKAAKNLDVRIGHVGAIPIKYKNTKNIRFIVLITIVKDAKYCDRKDLGDSLRKILSSNELLISDISNGDEDDITNGTN